MWTLLLTAHGHCSRGLLLLQKHLLLKQHLLLHLLLLPLQSCRRFGRFGCVGRSRCSSRVFRYLVVAVGRLRLVL